MQDAKCEKIVQNEYKTIENSQKEGFRMVKKQPEWSNKDQNNQSQT